MTPMVDLAFLLLTFFILTTTFYKSHIMQVDMPENIEDPSRAPLISDRDVLHLVLAENNKLYWWIGLDAPAALTNYSKDGIRQLLLQKSSANSKLMVLIKPKDKARYHNLVDILDEMTIAHISRFAIVEFDEDDKMKLSAELTAVYEY